MKHYRLLADIVLSFIVGNEQRDAIIGPSDGTIECDGATIWLVNKTERHASTTTANIVSVMLDRGTLEEIT